MKPSAGVVDGVSLGQLIPGLVYDLEPIAANYLISKRSAEELPASDPALAIPLDDSPTFLSSQSFGGTHVITTPRATAADKSHIKPRNY